VRRNIDLEARVVIERLWWADERAIVSYFMGDSSRLCHRWNFRFPLGSLAILLAISDRSVIGLSG
jgi:hypothetical protein